MDRQGLWNIPEKIKHPNKSEAKSGIDIISLKLTNVGLKFRLDNTILRQPSVYTENNQK